MRAVVWAVNGHRGSDSDFRELGGYCDLIVLKIWFAQCRADLEISASSAYRGKKTAICRFFVDSSTYFYALPNDDVTFTLRDSLQLLAETS